MQRQMALHRDDHPLQKSQNAHHHCSLPQSRCWMASKAPPAWRSACTWRCTPASAHRQRPSGGAGCDSPGSGLQPAKPSGDRCVAMCCALKPGLWIHWFPNMWQCCYPGWEYRSARLLNLSSGLGQKESASPLRPLCKPGKELS